MERNKNVVTTIDEYILQFTEHVQHILQCVRQVIHEIAPEATEKISYEIPTFYLDRNLVHFAAFKNHIGFYPGASGIEKFKSEIDKYHSGKGSVQFPINEPMPVNLIKDIVAFRVEEGLEISSQKASKKKAFSVEYLKEEISELLGKCDNKEAAIWASACAEHVLGIFENTFPKEMRPRQAISACKDWIADKTSVSDVRETAFGTHLVANEIEKNKAACAVARGCGHAAAVAYDIRHAGICATYCAKAVGHATQEAEKEREWQFTLLSEIKRKCTR